MLEDAPLKGEKANENFREKEKKTLDIGWWDERMQ